MVKKKNQYGDIQEEFIEQRAENRGWEELSVEQRQRLSNRFDVLAASVEGRSKIARTLLPGAPQEERRALKQKIRKNLPQKSGSIGESNVDTGQASTLNTGIPAPWNAPNLNYRASTYVPPAKTTTTTTTSKANTKRVTGEFGSTYKPSAFADWAADTKIPVYGEFMGAGIPVARVIRQGAREADEAYMAFKQGEIKEGLKNVAGVGRELAFGALDASLLKFGGKLAVAGGAKLVGRVGGKGVVGRLTTAADKIFTGGSVAAYRSGRAEASGKTAAANETRAVTSSVERTVAGAPAERLPTTAAATSTPKPKPQPKSRTKAKPKAPEASTPKVSEPASATSSPVKQVEVVQQNPVKVAGSEPPTVLQKTATPENIVAPVAEVKPATAATAAKPKATKKPQKAKKNENVKVEFEDKTNVAAATGKPASGEVVGGTNPKADQTSVGTTNLPPSMELSKTSPIPVEQKPQPSSKGPSVSEPAKRSQKSKPSSTEPKFKATKAQLDEAQKSKVSAQHLKLLREAPVEKVEIVTRIDPVTNQAVPVINPQSGTPWVKTTYVSQAKQMAQEQVERAAKRSGGKRPGDGARVEFDDGKGKVLGQFPADNVNRQVKIEFDVEGVPATPEAKARMEQIRRESTVNKVPVKGGEPEYPQTFAGQTRKQLDAMEAAEGALMRGENLPKNRRRLATRKKPPKVKEGLTRYEETGFVQPTYFDPKTGRQPVDKRSIEEIRESTQMYIDIADAKVKRVEKKPLTNKEAKQAAKQQQLNKESAARMKSPELQAQAKVEEVRRRTASQEAQRAQELAVGRRRMGKTGLGVEGRYGEVRAKLRREQRQARQRKYPKEVNQSLHAFMLREPSKPIGKNRTLYDEMLDVIDARPRTRSRGTIDQPSSPANVTPTPTPKPEGIQYFEMNPAKIDYEQLLRIEQAGFKLQVTRGAPTRFTRDRGVRGTFSKTGEGISKEEFGNLMKSTEYTREDLLRLIKSTSGGK